MLKKQVTINSIGSVVVMLAQWLISVLLVRLDGFHDAGVFSLAMSVSNVFIFFANYGIRSYQITDTDYSFSDLQYLYARIFTTGFAAVACGIYLAIAQGYSATERAAIFVYFLYSAINILSDTLMGSLQLHQRMDINGYSNILRGTVCFCVYMGCYLISHHLVFSLCGMAIASMCVTFFYDARLYIRIVSPRPCQKGDVQAGIIRLLQICFALMLSAVLPVLATAIPRRTIQLQLGTEALGRFSTIFTPTVLISTMVPAVIVGFIPGISAAWKRKNRLCFSRMMSGCYAGIAMVTLLIELLALLCGRFFMCLVFGEQILPYYPLFYWAILATGMNTAASFGNMVFPAMQVNRYAAYSSCLAVIMVWLISALAVPAFDIYGAAYALIIGYSTQILVQLICILRQVKFHFV